MYNCEVSFGNVEVGQSYPIYGAITKFIDERPGVVLIEVNYSILARLYITDVGHIESLKERAFEPAIFVSKVVSKEPQVTIECSTIVFGQKSNFSA